MPNCPKCKGVLEKQTVNEQTAYICQGCGARFVPQKPPTVSEKPQPSVVGVKAPQQTAPTATPTPAPTVAPQPQATPQQTEQVPQQQAPQQQAPHRPEFCPHCGSPVEDGAMFCNKCGKSLTGKRVCPTCGSLIADDSQFCPKCGQSVVKQPKQNKAKKFFAELGAKLKGLDKKKKTALIASVAAFMCVVILATTLGVVLTDIFRPRMMKKIELGFSLEQVKDVLGAPYYDEKGTYMWGEKKYTKLDQKMEKATDFSKLDKLYKKLEKMEYKSIIAQFDKYKQDDVDKTKLIAIYLDLTTPGEAFMDGSNLPPKNITSVTPSVTRIAQGASLIRMQASVELTCDDKSCAKILIKRANYSTENVGMTTVKMETRWGEISFEIEVVAVEDIDCAHVANDNCICSICGLEAHKEDENCTCEYCKNTFHNYNSNHICTKCGDVIFFEFVEVTSGYQVAKLYQEEMTEVVIPSTYQGEPVVSIGDYAFNGCYNLTSITIPDGVTSIGDYAFNGCYNLTSITIPDGVTSIGNDAFYNCDKLVEVYNKSNLTITKGSTQNGYAGRYALNVYTEEGGSKLSTDGDYVIYTDGDEKILVAYNGTDTELTLPNYITKIIDYAFNSALTSISIPDGVTSIGGNAFSRCRKLTYNEYDNAYYLGNATNPYAVLIRAKETTITSCEINSNTKLICASAFSRCDKLTSITIPDSVTSIGDSAFYGCSNLTNATVPACAISALPKSNLQTVVITSGTSGTSIGYRAFEGCSNLTSVVIGDSVTSIGDYAFDCCNNLTSITISNGVIGIGDHAFYYCSSLTSIAIPDSVTSIGDYAFSCCSNLSYNEYDNAYYLGNATNPYVVLIKAKDSSITSCEINSNTKFIHSGAFYECSSLTSVSIHDSVTSIGDNAFYGCYSLTSITIPDGVTSIGDYAFNGCYNLTSITIPDGVTSIGDNAFYGCYSLTYNEYNNAYYLGNATNQYAVLIRAKETTITSCEINSNTKLICASAFSRCDKLTSITIPDGVTSIGDYAFEGCSNLTNVTYNGTKAQWNAMIKGSDWEWCTVFTVYCTDGNLSRSEA